MDKTFLISYDLKQPSGNYAELYGAIKSYTDWQHPMESTWVIKVDEVLTANDIYTKLRMCIDEKDHLFVVDITSQDRQGWLAKTFWSWLKL